MSICPKNKSSKGRRDKRRANWKMTAPALVKCSKCGELMMPHRVCKNCGSYNKKKSSLRTNPYGKQKDQEWNDEFPLGLFVSAEKVIIISQITGCIIGVNRIKW